MAENYGLLMVVVLASGFFFISQEGYLTPNPEPTPTPYPTNPPFNNYIKAVYLNPSDYSEQCINFLDVNKVNLVFMQVGEWRTDGTIFYYSSDSVYQNFNNVIKARLPSCQVQARVLCVGGFQQPVNLADENVKQNMIASAVECVSKGFDGFNDDTENYLGSESSLVSYWNSLNQRLNSAGKKLSVDMMAYFNYPYEEMLSSLNVDLVCVMLYNDFGSFDKLSFQTLMNNALEASNSPVLISVYPKGFSYSTLQGWVSEQLNVESYNKYVGFGVWQYSIL